MHNEFDAERFDLLSADRVHIAGHAFGHNSHGDLDVWTKTGETGTAFVHQISIDGAAGPMSQGVYARACYFLQEKATGQYFFLERDDRCFTLQAGDFFGAHAYLGAEAAKVDTWLAGLSPESGAIAGGE